MKYRVVARRQIFNSHDELFSDSILERLDGIRHGPVHEVGTITTDVEEKLICEFKKLHPEFRNAEYEVVKKK